MAFVCASTDPVIQSNQGHHLYMFFSDHRCNMFHFCMDIRLRLFSSHYMVPRSLGQRTIMNFSSLSYFQAVCPCDQTNFQIEHKFKFRMPAEGRTRLGKSILHKPARCIHADKHGCDCKVDSSNHSWKRSTFFDPMAWIQEPKKRSRKKKEPKQGRTKERRREKT